MSEKMLASGSCGGLKGGRDGRGLGWDWGVASIPCSAEAAPDTERGLQIPMSRWTRSGPQIWVRNTQYFLTNTFYSVYQNFLSPTAHKMKREFKNIYIVYRYL